MLPEKVDTLVVAACILHNFLTRPPDAEQWSKEAEVSQSTEPIGFFLNGNGQQACAVRQTLVQYFSSEAGRYRK